MTTPALVVRFQLQDDACCVLCNPVMLADYERPCVNVTICEAAHVRPIRAQSPAICLPCIERLARAAAGRRESVLLEPEVSNLIQDLRGQAQGKREPKPHEH